MLAHKDHRGAAVIGIGILLSTAAVAFFVLGAL